LTPSMTVMIVAIKGQKSQRACSRDSEGDLPTKRCHSVFSGMFRAIGIWRALDAESDDAVNESGRAGDSFGIRFSPFSPPGSIRTEFPVSRPLGHRFVDCATFPTPISIFDQVGFAPPTCCRNANRVSFGRARS